MILIFWLVVVWLILCFLAPIKKMTGSWSISWHTAFLPFLLPFYVAIAFAVFVGIPVMLFLAVLGSL